MFKRLGFGLLCCAWLLATPAFAQVEITEAARQHFKAGVNFMQDPDGARYEEAYREFKAAYAASPSWKILGNLGIAAMKLERDGEAIDAMERYLNEGGKELPDDEREQFERDLSTLKSSVVRVTLTSVPPGAVVTDERIPVQGSSVTNRYTLENGQLELGIRPGHHRMVARLEGYEDAVWEFDASPGMGQSHAFELKVPAQAPAPATTSPADLMTGEAPRDMERPVPTGVYIGLAATGVFTAGATVTGIMALGKNSEFEDENGENQEAAQDAYDATKTLNLVTDVLIAGAFVSAAVTTYLYLDRPAVPAGQDARRFRVTPAVGRDVALVSMSGSF
ncbi:MAG TPA: hypothetical protein VFU02_10700 [Polyangiaceae bacterium]|nr:hypothetical protein [Polyangiaceae bacterium]